MPAKHILILAIVALVSAQVDARTGPKRMNHQRRAILDPRQDIGGGNGNAGNGGNGNGGGGGGGGGIIPISIPAASPPTTAADDDDVTTRPPAPATTAPANTPSSVPPIIEVTISAPASAIVATPTTSTREVETLTTTSQQAQTTRSQVRVQTEQSTIGNSVVNVTRTSTIEAPSASSSASAESQTQGEEKKSGIGKGTLIAIIVVASSCAGVFIIWTIIRRWKLKPTREFERRLQPINFGPAGEKDGAYEPMVSSTSLNRADSFGSNGSEKPPRRRDSFGSLSGSQRGGGGSVISSQRAGSQRGYAPIDAGSRTGGTTYPPSSAAWSSYSQQQPPAHQLPYNAPSPPRLANPYGNDYGATHGIQRSDTIQSSRYGGGDSYGRY